ncbi:alpha/beta hydrolase family protein [Pseudarthrobacter sp. L1SW]|uniref:alpha/beta hydrolase n=1 Tax=Pseudarthrobacter sp. L1SW TaxID=2851598 RepID=UPI001E3F7442|nr:alpha/beta hydrolase-fold protein [Pseudarthrobacter sp. L1SW]UEL30450.1 prolyl oligopeptidase family serine peptidase [Pseudarthrobacter sp. L1SW]
MDWFFDIRLIDGPVYWASLALGAAGAAYLLLPPSALARRTWLLKVIAATAAAFALVASVHWALINVFSVFPENIPDTVLLWVVPGVAALLLLLLRMPRNTWRRGAAGLVAALLVAALSAVQINAYFGLHKTVSDLFGAALARIPTLEQELMRQPGQSDGVALRGWVPQGDVPAEGELRKAFIPGDKSGMNVRDAYIYLPPAYFAQNRPALPVLVLVAGQPGGPADWLTGGQLQSHLDSYAAAHGGVAPVVVVPDANGSQSANTMCMDSRIAHADTYLSEDVPNWIKSTLAVDTNHSRWAAGGFSFGGTCALQLGTRHPDLFPAVLSFSGEAEPAIAKERQKTIDASFPGDPEAFNRQTPLAIMKEQRFDGSGLYLTAGQDDPEFVAYLRTLAAAATEAGFTVRAHEVEHTGHSWDTSSKRIADALDFLAERWGTAG